MRRIALDAPASAVNGSLLIHDAVAQARAILLVMPGGRCAARRYEWLVPLTEEGIMLCILDGALSNPVEQEGPSPAILQLAAALRHLAGMRLPIHAAGHSAGAAALLDALDPPSNPAARLPEDFRLPLLLDSVTSMGCSLQPRTLDWLLPHRHEDRPLHRPPATRLLFLAGEEDAVAPPALVLRTCARFAPPAPVIVMARATHYGWAGEREAGDPVPPDADPALDTIGQRARTLACLAAVIAGHPIRPAPGDRLIVPFNAQSHD